MKVSTKVLLQLPIGTLFHEVEVVKTNPIFEIVGYASNNYSLKNYSDIVDLIVRPLFQHEYADVIKYGFTEMSDSEINSREWYVLQREDKDIIAKKIGFEPSGIRIIGVIGKNKLFRTR